jgi:glutamine synthetase
MPEPLSGLLTLEELTQSVQSGQIDTVIAAFPDMYGRLLGKRFAGPHFLDHVAPHGTHGCNYLLACDMDMDTVSGYQFASWAGGYGDFGLAPDWATLRRAAWLDRTALVLCDVVEEARQQPVEIAPRQVLRRQVERAEKMGYCPKGMTEVEFFIFRETFESAHEKRYHSLRTFGHYIEDYHLFQGSKEEELMADLRRGLEASGIPVECSKGEWGPGQQELNLCYCDVLEAADRHTLYKQACKELAYQKGLAVTFMAKWHEDQAGSSQHIHLSLWEDEGEGRGRKGREGEGGERTGHNAFVGDQELAAGLPVKCSDTFRHFMGGLLAHLREVTLFLAPNVNSYKRFQSASFAPTRIAWAYDNRTTAFRVVGHGSGLRVECRVAGADANPYLTFAVLLAAGLDGLRQRTDPPPLFSGDAYQQEDLPQVPRSLPEAIAVAEASAFLREAFGEEVLEHYLHFARVEQRKFEEVVTDWERARYFERV